MTGYIVGLIGLWMAQDGIASMLYYPKEGIRNHLARIARTALGVWLVVIGGMIL